jgi:pilus assembly protein CpaB
MRAVSVPVSSSALADRLFRPGDYVDVMVTYRVQVNSRSNPEAQSLVNRYASETVIENVRVLAIDSNDTKAVDEVEDDGKKKKRQKSSKKAIITLEVTPENAERLVLSRKMGDLSFALRSIGDNTPPTTDRQTTDVNMSRVMTKLTEMKETTSAIRIYNGNVMVESQARMVKPQTNAVDFSVEENEQQSRTIIIDPALLNLGDEDE